MSKVWSVVPGTVGSALGIYLLFYPATWKLILLAIVAVALLLLLRVVHIMFSSAPRLYGWLLEGWALFLPIATGLIVYAMLRITVIASAGDLIPTAALTPAQKAEVVKYAIGVLGVLVAAFVAGDPAKAENPFWPSKQFKSVAGHMAPSQSPDNPEIWYAAAGDCTRYNEVCGWGFKARRERARILSR